MERKLFTFLLLYAVAMVFMYVSASPAYLASTAVGENGRAAAEVGKLDMITFNPEKIEGVYHSSGGGGVHFVSEAVGESHYLGIHTLSGELLMSVKRQSAVATAMTVMGRQFLILNHTVSETERYLTGYVVPDDFSQRLSESVKNQPVNNALNILRHLEFETASTTRNAVVEELLARPEVEMIRGIVRELATLQITGAENQPAMAIYVLAMRLTKFQNHKQMNLPAQRVRHGTCLLSWLTGEHYCSNNDRCCVTCPVGSGCTGMCGPGCNPEWYWFAVCTTWCYQQGCYDHDVCCNRNLNSWGCQVPIGFSCSHYDCYSDANVSLA